MKGLTFNFTAILSVFVPLSFYCCLSGTLLTLLVLPFSMKYESLKKAIKKLATIFLLIWILNIFANFFLLFTNSTSLAYDNNIQYTMTDYSKML